MDQHLNMDGVQRLGAGILLRSEWVDRSAVRTTVTQMLEDSRYSEAALELAQKFAAYHAPSRFQELLRGVAGAGKVPQEPSEHNLAR
jgi:UDP:flavonoid glycosyltransferase YjiC (YdhE family)